MSMSLAVEPIPLTLGADEVIRVGHTRVTLDTVVFSFQEGSTPEEIAQQYPSLDLADLYAVITYYLRHRSTVESYLRKRRDQAVGMRRENEERFDPEGIRDRLAARRLRKE